MALNRVISWAEGATSETATSDVDNNLADSFMDDEEDLTSSSAHGKADGKALEGRACIYTYVYICSAHPCTAISYIYVLYCT